MSKDKMSNLNITEDHKGLAFVVLCAVLFVVFLVYMLVDPFHGRPFNQVEISIAETEQSFTARTAFIQYDNYYLGEATYSRELFEQDVVVSGTIHIDSVDETFDKKGREMYRITSKNLPSFMANDNNRSVKILVPRSMIDMKDVMETTKKIKFSGDFNKITDDIILVNNITEIEGTKGKFFGTIERENKNV